MSKICISYYPTRTIKLRDDVFYDKGSAELKQLKTRLK